LELAHAVGEDRRSSHAPLRPHRLSVATRTTPELVSSITSLPSRPIGIKFGPKHSGPYELRHRPTSMNASSTRFGE
jgi:hypothetical protein